MKFLTAAVLAVLASAATASPIEARQRGRGPVWSSWYLQISAPGSHLDAMNIGTRVDPDGVTRVGVYTGNQDALRITTIQGGDEGRPTGNDGLTLSVEGSIIQHVLGLKGSSNSTLRDLIDVDTPEDADKKPFKYEYEKFSFVNGQEELDKPLGYEVSWPGGLWRAYPSVIPEAGHDIMWASLVSDEMGTQQWEGVKIIARLRSQS